LSVLEEVDFQASTRQGAFYISACMLPESSMTFPFTLAHIAIQLGYIDNGKEVI
jgi:hypothetical protein